MEDSAMTRPAAERFILDRLSWDAEQALKDLAKEKGNSVDEEAEEIIKSHLKKSASGRV